MEFVRKHPWILMLSLLFIGVNGFFIFQDNYFLNALPFALIIMYMAIFHLNTTFLLLVFLTPLSINLEEFTEGKIGLFLPTEPILFGLLLLLLMRQLYKPFIPKDTWSHGISLSLFFYLFWVFFTAITSSDPLVSFKFLLMKSWFIFPILFIGSYVFDKKRNITTFLWLFSVSMTVMILYTLIRHSGYAFGEKEGHWVMEPFFKDHTIYGSIVAINVFFILGLLRSKKNLPLMHVTLIGMLVITLVGLYFSYTRGAWLSVVVALLVWVFIHYKVKFKYLLITGITALLLIAVNWNAIQISLSKNRSEHTTEEFDERLKSATNITSDASNLERLNRWSAAWRMFKERPIVGFGPGTYAFEYAPYQDPEKLTIISTNLGDAGNAHSEYLGPLAEMGFLGFLSIVVFVSVLFYKGITLYIKYPKEDAEMRTVLLFMILAMVTYFFHGLLNNYLDTDKAAIPVYGVCAVIIALERSYKNKYLLTENQ